MLLPLISPASNTFLKDWPAYNEFNCQEVDDYAGPCLTTHGLQPYNPQLTAVTSNPVLGTGGFIRGFYYKIFDQCWVWGEFRFGSAGASGGTGAWMISLPFTVTNLLGFSTNIGEAPVVGNGYIWDDSSATARFPITAHLRTATQLMFGFRMGSGAGSREVSGAVPAAVAINDGLSFSARFQRTP
jgi:hypothetical protein